MDFKIIKKITIPGECISKKNNMVAYKRGNFTQVTHKDVWKNYEKQALAALANVEPINANDYPVYLHIFYYRRTKRSFDLHNMCQGICDVLQGDLKEKNKSLRHKVIAEDDMNHLIVINESPCAGWSIDKHEPRTVLTFSTDPYYMTKEDILKGIK